VNQLIEAKNNNELNRVTQRWTRYELIVIDEMAYVAMPEKRPPGEAVEIGALRSTTDRNPPQKTMTSCWRTIRPAG